ncbi:MAG: BNR repeat-containing protein [Akkermansiaceae bacterium]|nr:BNR repeat-containing protein [Akkermansiaceae bacterium]
MNTPFLPALFLTFIAGLAGQSSAETRSATIVDSIDVAPVWSAHPVGFSLLTRAPFQFVAFYDDQRQLTVAQRRLDERKWTFNRLPVTTGWDSHNYVTLAIDDQGFLHLSGDMHCVPLKYFRSHKPLDASTFDRIDRMTGVKETRCTYPRFSLGPRQELIFTYRDGGSGNGNQIYNVYDSSTRTWSRLMDGPLTDGEGQRNAYLNGPVKGPDGYFHLAWVWRETPDAATNHDLSYARSKDLRHWETSAGRPLVLPIKLNDGVIVDPVPQHGGMINGNTRIGFDDNGRVTISYHKHDAAGYTQPWTARLEDGGWKFHQITDWRWRWDFGGGGSLPFDISIGPVTRESDGRLTQPYSHAEFGGGTWLLDPVTLRSTGRINRRSTPPALGKIEGKFPGLKVKTTGDSGTSDKPGIRYMLRWETLEPIRDKPRSAPLPEPSMLRLYMVKP